MNKFILFCSRFALSLHQIVVIMTIKDFFSFRQNKYFWINIAAMIVVVGLLLFGTLKGIDIYTHHGEAVVVPDVKGMTVGEAGKGFAVVAEEIGKLARATSDATTNITAIILEIQKEIEVVSSQMFSMKDETEKCMGVMGDTRAVFEQINQEIDDVGAAVQGLEGAVGILNSNKAKVVDRFSDISSETEELAASSQDILGKVDQQSVEMENIHTAIESLHNVVTKLNEIMDQFTV